MSFRSKGMRAATAGVAALSLTMLAACANYSQASPSTSASAPASGSSSAAAPTLVTPGKLTMCTHLSYKPFEYKDGDKVVGFDVDVVDLVAKKLGVTVDVVDLPFEQITSGAAFTAKRCDVGAAATTIRADRQKAALFSDPYFKATQALLVKDASIKELDQLKGKIVGVQVNTTGLDYAKDNAAKYGYEVKVFDDFPTQANAVLAGTADAAINDNGVVYDFAKENPGVQVTKEFQTGEEYGINMALDNTALLAVVNQALTDAKADGSYNTIYKKWFGTDAPK